MFDRIKSWMKRDKDVAQVARILDAPVKKAAKKASGRLMGLTEYGTLTIGIGRKAKKRVVKRQRTRMRRNVA